MRVRTRRRFILLVATDGSPEARAAVAATVALPWPPGTRIQGVLARRRMRTFQRPQYVLDAFDRAFERAAHAAQRVLRRRWPDASVSIDDAWAQDAILERARRLHATVIVLGSRKQGMAARLLLGSVSRQIVRRAPCSVLVVRGRLRTLARVLIGVDGSTNSHRAVALVAALAAPPGGRLSLVRIVEPVRQPSIALAPNAAQAVIAREVMRLNAEALHTARHEVARLAEGLRRSGWKVQPLVRVGHPVPGLLRVAADTRAQLLAIGARGIGGVERLLLGSVAEGVLNRARVSVLVARE